jgi:hypothetical protein
MVALAVGVYAELQLSNTLTTSWTVVESGNNLELSWYADQPGGYLSRGVWYTTQIRLRNTGEATYTVIDRFTITTGPVLPTNCITIQYYDGTNWVDITSVITDWGTGTIRGYFGPLTGFSCGPGYDETTLFRYKFESNAPLTEYSFSSWVEQI